MSTVVEDNQDQTVVVDERADAEIVSDPEECYRRSVELLVELGFPKGVLPLKDLVECGRNRETGFVWMKQRKPHEHYFEKTGTRVSYATEVTSYVEKGEDEEDDGGEEQADAPLGDHKRDEPGGEDRREDEDHVQDPVGIGKSFPSSAFMTEEEEEEEMGKERENHLLEGRADTQQSVFVEGSIG